MQSPSACDNNNVVALFKAIVTVRNNRFSVADNACDYHVRMRAHFAQRLVGIACVFVDDDKQAYFYYGGGGRCVGAKMKNNMMELAEPLRPMEGLKDFHEAAWIHKRNGIYYLSYADNHAVNGKGANRLNYATSNSPLGPWTYQGIYLEPTGCDTSHGSIVEYK